MEIKFFTYNKPMIYARVFLNNKEEREILQGFPWVFDNEISHIKHRKTEKEEWKNEPLAQCTVEDGSVVEVYSKAGGFLGSGVLNKKSKITVRIATTLHADKFMENPAEYWEEKVHQAYDLRTAQFSPYDSYRLIFAEADFVPGFVCERFCSEDGKVYLVVQFSAMACEVFRSELVSALVKVCKPDGIYEHDDENARDKEGLAHNSGWIYGKGDSSIIIKENGVRLGVDLANGQKTGYFLDQKLNRVAAASFCKGKRVLDTFTHTGAFGLNAFMAGAKDVTSVDISEDAVKMVENNIALNKAGKVMKAVCADVFDLLKKYETEGQKFDVIILDPPAFTKSAKMIEKAYGGYKEINLRAMRLLNKGGILVTCSCSHFMETQMFCDMIMHAAMDSHCRVQILEKRGAGPDHPVLLGYPKSEYLKCVICKVM